MNSKRKLKLKAITNKQIKEIVLKVYYENED